jgi:ribosomal protein S20
MNGKHRARTTPQDRSRRQTETSDYVAMMTRIIGSFGDRIAQDPAALVHLADLQTALREAVDRGIFEANRSARHYSQNEIAAILGISRQGVAKRIGIGEQVYADAQAAQGAGPLVRIADIRARRAALLAGKGVQDKTGSARELRAV